MMTFKQKEVLDKIMVKVQKKFPESRILSITELNGNSFWIQILFPADDDQFMVMVKVLGKQVLKALLDYGFDFQFVPVTEKDAEFSGKGNEKLAMAGA